MLWLATLGHIGYLPAPGTMATLATLPIAFLLQTIFSFKQYSIACIIITGILGYAVVKILPFCKQNDPSEIVADEIVGCLVTFAGISMTLPVTVIGFLLFRFLDITKWFGINYLQKLPGVWGVMIDDVVAGLIANIILRLLHYYAF